VDAGCDSLEALARFGGPVRKDLNGGLQGIGVAVDLVEILKDGGKVPLQGCGEFRDVPARSPHPGQSHDCDNGKRKQGRCGQSNADFPRHGQRPPPWSPPIA